MVMAFHFFGQVMDWHMNVVSTDRFLSYIQQFQWNQLPKFLETYFYLGVNLFVIASGFGLYLSYLKEGRVFRWATFLQKRLFRILPAAVLSIVVLFFFRGLYWHQWPLDQPLVNFFPFLAGINLFSDVTFFPPINGETWFLGLVIQLYLVFPFLARLLDTIGKTRFLLLLFAISVVFRVIYYFFIASSVQTLSYGIFVGRMFEFGFGMVVALLLSQGKNFSKWWKLGLLMFLGYFFAFSFPFTDGLMGIGLFAVLWPLAVKVSTNSRIADLSKKLSGESYLMFLIHHPVIWILNGEGLTDTWTWAGLVGFFVVVFVSYFSAKIGNLFLKAIKL